MKIRKGFVTNSSSTSFILLCSNVFNEEDFFELMGVEKESEFYEMMYDVFEDIQDSIKSVEEYCEEPYWEKGGQTFDEHLKEIFSEDVYKRYIVAKDEGKYIYIGSLSSDGGLLTCFMCCDHFIEENDKIYFNYTDCYW